MSKRHNDIYTEYRQMFPRYHDDTARWKPDGDHSIQVELNDGSIFSYDGLNHKLHLLRTPRQSLSSPDGHIRESDWRDEFSRRLSRVMSSRGYSQKDLADATGISEATISNYLSGKATPSSYKLIRIIGVLKCNPEDIIPF